MSNIYIIVAYSTLLYFTLFATHLLSFASSRVWQSSSKVYLITLSSVAKSKKMFISVAGMSSPLKDVPSSQTASVTLRILPFSKLKTGVL